MRVSARGGPRRVTGEGGVGLLLPTFGRLRVVPDRRMALADALLHHHRRVAVDLIHGRMRRIVAPREPNTAGAS